MRSVGRRWWVRVGGWNDGRRWVVRVGGWNDGSEGDRKVDHRQMNIEQILT